MTKMIIPADQFTIGDAERLHKNNKCTSIMKLYKDEDNSCPELKNKVVVFVQKED